MEIDNLHVYIFLMCEFEMKTVFLNVWVLINIVLYVLYMYILSFVYMIIIQNIVLYRIRQTKNWLVQT